MINRPALFPQGAESFDQDRLYAAISCLIAENSINTILDIGSSDGTGTTRAIRSGISGRKDVLVVGLEITSEGVAACRQRYEGDVRFVFLQCSTIKFSDFPPWELVEEFHRTASATFTKFPLPQLHAWRERDIAWANAAPITDGLAAAKRNHDVDIFDLTIIDGSEFTGLPELDAIYGSRYIVLDDVDCFKNHANVQRLTADPRYECLILDRTVRNGIAAFRRRG